jgi:hypothetical protein
MFFKPDGLITALRFGRDPDGNSFSFYHLEVWSSPIVGISQLQIDTTAAGQDRFSPISGRLSKFVSLPMNGTWGSWGFSPPSLGLTLSWPGKVINPGFVLGPEVEGPGSKAPENGGAGDKATKLGHAITGMLFTCDPSDGDVGLRVWYRPLL